MMTRVGLAMLVVATLFIASPTQARSRTLVTDGDCQQIAAFVAVPIENVRSLVPASFAIVGEETGDAQVLVTGGRCDSWSLDGQPVPPLEFGLVSVAAYPKGRDPGLEGYDLWWQADQHNTHLRWRALGIFSAFVPDLAFSVQRGPTGGVASASAWVPWRESPFSISGEVMDAPPRPIEFPSAHWYEGRHGRVFGDHVNTKGGVLPALVTIRAEAGSPLARVLGSTTVNIVGGYLDFHHFGTTGLVPSD